MVYEFVERVGERHPAGRGWGRPEDGNDLRVAQDRATRIDSLADLNFMDESTIIVWTIRRIGC